MHWASGVNGPERRLKPLHEGREYQPSVDAWDEECAKWKAGWRPEHADDDESKAMTYEQWAGQRPHRDDYMPIWPESECTYLMMYETTSEGTPISPAFKTPDRLARWLTDNRASAFGDTTATYEQWLRVCNGGYACSAVAIDGVMQSGVAALTDAQP
jgi:hypothetical protein